MNSSATDKLLETVRTWHIITRSCEETRWSRRYSNRPSWRISWYRGNQELLEDKGILWKIGKRYIPDYVCCNSFTQLACFKSSWNKLNWDWSAIKQYGLILWWMLHILRDLFLLQKDKLQSWVSGKDDDDGIPRPESKFLFNFYVMVEHQVFDILINIVIVLNVLLVLIESVETYSNRKCSLEIMEDYGELFVISNYVFLVLYTLEAIFKVIMCPSVGLSAQ